MAVKNETRNICYLSDLPILNKMQVFSKDRMFTIST